MLPTPPVHNIPQPASVEFTPTPQQIADFDSMGIKDVIKAFLLRQFVKKEIRDNTQQGIRSGVTIIDLQTNHKIIGNDETSPHFAASVNKLPVTMLVLEELRAGRVTLDTQFTWQPADRRAGAGVYDQETSALQGTVRELLHDLLNRSGNTAVRILVNGVLGGSEAVNARLAQLSDIPNTRLIPVDPNRFYLGFTTSAEALSVLRRTVSTNDQYTQLVKDYLATNIFETYGVKSQLAGNDYIILVNKMGQLNDWDGENNRHDVGIIYNTKTNKSYGYSFLTSSPLESATATARAEQSLKNMGLYALRFSGDRAHPDTQGTQSAAPAPAPEGKILY